MPEHDDRERTRRGAGGNPSSVTEAPAEDRPTLEELTARPSASGRRAAPTVGRRDDRRSRSRWAAAVAIRRQSADARPFQPRGRRTSLPQTLGDFELLEEIGRGGMGVVYRASRRRSLDREVAVKVLLRGADASADDQVRFRAEAEAAAPARSSEHRARSTKPERWTDGATSA